MSKQVIMPKPGTKIDLSTFDPDFNDDYHKSGAREALKSLQKRMRELQAMLYAQGTQSLLIVLQAMDAGGKDGTIRRVFEGVNPQGVRVTSFKKPTEEELAHDFLWRVHQHTPRKGFIGIFNRSHYEDVLVVRVNELVPQSVWEKRYDHINHFEKLLADSGTRILKFFLHISKEEQKERLQERLDIPEKRWKFSLGDLPVRQKWDAYMHAYEDVLTRCNTEYAPWYIVPANKKWFRNLIIARAIVETLEDMNLAYPEPEADLEGVVIPD
ncbi:MAG: polyphosphate kinase 2 family protein [Chloroflexi bacterium]|nr:MAG: polyphosphate kinase 2 family protein [Chloroflexota bacterium]